MAQNNMSTRALAQARRKAMSSGGKAALSNNGRSNGRVRGAEPAKPQTPAPAAPAPVSSSASSPSKAPTARRAAAPTARSAPVARVANPTRELSLARRRALSSKGKTAQQTTDRVRTAEMQKSAKANVAAPTNKEDCGCGCGGRDKTQTAEATTSASRTSSSVSSPSPIRHRNNGQQKKRRPEIANNPAKLAALARRKALSSRGKAGISSNGMSQAQTARAANPNLSARELAQALREQRSRTGKSGQKASRPTGRIRSKPTKNENGPAQDAPWKVGASETSYGQTVTGTMVGRDDTVTGNEASTCREVTGTEYMGAEIFREFCQTEPLKTPLRIGMSETLSGNSVTGNEVGRSQKVTGDEPGTCQRVTGTEYFDAQQSLEFCGTKSDNMKPMAQVMGETRKGKTVTGDNVSTNAKVTGGEAGAGRDLTGAQYVQKEQREAPAKVGVSSTLRGGRVTGTEVGRTSKMTGDEAGSCRAITGDDYVSLEQFQSFCNSTPAPQDQKVGMSATNGGKHVTGTMSGRSERVTGNEPGTCKTVTGTPYAGLEQFNQYCEAPQVKQVAARTNTAGVPAARIAMTGIQPSVGGKMTGDEKGACETVSGTPYVGQTQQAAICPAPSSTVSPAQAATPDSSDFPQTLEQAAGESAENLAPQQQEWGQFSVAAPSHAAQDSAEHSAVTGTRYEQGHITGPFGMAGGKVTGTEEARFTHQPPAVAVEALAEEAEPKLIDGRVKSRITGEGMDAGTRITGDDWARGEHVTGTEGTSAMRRNETRRGAGMDAMAFMQRNREVANEAPKPTSRVTGASGNTDKGSLITYSGGARG